MRAKRVPIRAVLIALGLLVLAAAHHGAEIGMAKGKDGVQASLAERVAAALARGEKAEMRHNADELGRLSHFLDTAGARPLEDGTPDMSARWASLARAQGFEMEAPYRGRALGPAYRRGRLDPGTRLELEQTFLAGRKAEVVLMPLTPSLLFLEISDGGERPICLEGSRNPPAKCGWLPVYTKRHSVTVRNAGRAPADYFIVMN